MHCAVAAPELLLLVLLLLMMRGLLLQQETAYSSLATHQCHGPCDTPICRAHLCTLVLNLFTFQLLSHALKAAKECRKYSVTEWAIAGVMFSQGTNVLHVGAASYCSLPDPKSV